MEPVLEQSWNITEVEALQLQKELASKVEIDDRFGDIEYIAGTDVAYAKEGNTLIAGIVVLKADTHEIVEVTTASGQVEFPYIPGLFSFRELPPLIKAFSQLTTTPDLIICDGQGYAHPRRFGLACHLGVTFDIPTIGCGKTLLLGEYQEPDNNRGAFAPLLDNDEIIGHALRTQNGINPIFVSVGHRVSLESATQLVLNLCSKYRLPETTRIADQLVKAVINGKELNFQ